MWTLTGSSPRRVLIYSGNMFNELPDVPYVITMEVVVGPDPMDVELPDGLRVAYTRGESQGQGDGAGDADVRP